MRRAVVILILYVITLGCFGPICFAIEDGLGKIDPAVIVATGDAEGHINPCQSCPAHLGFGGLARRATLTAQLRRQCPTLLLDAGNALFGAESAASRGQIIADAMARLKYDVINISYRDFRYGKTHTTQVIKRSGLQSISANILDDASGEPIFPPFAVLSCGRTRIAVIGLTESPSHLQVLPRLREELDGIRICSPLEALNRQLNRARQSSAAVIVLYYGSASSLNETLERIGPSVSAFIVAGADSDELLPAGPDRPPPFVPEPHGKSLVKLILRPPPTAGQTPSVSVELIPVAPTLAPDSAMQQWLDQYPLNKK